MSQSYLFIPPWITTPQRSRYRCSNSKERRCSHILQAGFVYCSLGKPLFRSVASEGPSRNTSDLTEGEWVQVPKEPRFTGSHSTTLCRFLVRFIRFTLGVSVVHLLTQGRSRARRKKVIYTLTRNLFRLPRYHPCCDFYLLTTSIPWGSINFLTKAFSIYYPL